MWNYKFEISCFKPMHEIEEKHQLLYAVNMLFIRWNWVVRKPKVLFLLRNWKSFGFIPTA
jgi:hypothetical protein